MMVSVVVPAYNAEKFVADAIESMLAQTFSNWELVVVDDGSTDHTFDILKKYAEQDARIKVFSQKNAGPSAARRYGVENSTGQWVSFLDADDCLEHNAIEIFTEKVNKGTSDIYIFSHHDGWKYRPLTIKCEEYRRAAIRQDFCTGPVSKLFAMNVLDRGGEVWALPDGMNSGEDWLMNIRIAFQLTGQATFCEEIIYKCRTDINPLSLMKSFKGSWDYDNRYYEEFVKSIPEEHINGYAADLVNILSKQYHNCWRKTWRLPQEAHSSYIFSQLEDFCAKYEVKPPFNERLEAKISNPVTRFVLDMAERCYGVLKRHLYRNKRHKYYDNR